MMTGIRHELMWLAITLLHSGILLQSAAADSGEGVWGENLLQNPSFDEGAVHWVLQKGAHHPNTEPVYAKFDIDQNVTRSPSRSARASGNAETTYWYTLESDAVPVKAGRRYKLSGWMMTDNVHQEGAQYNNSNVYVRFVDASGNRVASGRFQVRTTRRLIGTNDWTKLERVVTAPEGALQAVVGCVLTCSGTARFDDIGLSEQREAEWKRRETDRFILFYEGADAPTEGAIRAIESHLSHVENVLGIKREEKIEYYKYRSNARKEAWTGDASDAHLEGDEIHAVSWEDRRVMVSIVVKPLGDSIALWRTGIAIHLAGPWGDQDLDSYARMLAQTHQLLPIGQLLDNQTFHSFAAGVTHPQAGSFVRYLIHEYGMDCFKKLYPIADPSAASTEVPARFRSIYGAGLHEVELAWRKFLVPEAESGPPVDASEPPRKDEG